MFEGFLILFLCPIKLSIYVKRIFKAALLTQDPRERYPQLPKSHAGLLYFRYQGGYVWHYLQTSIQIY